MKTPLAAAALAGALACLAIGSAVLSTGLARAHGDDDRRAFGEPGDPKKPSRMVEITMREAQDGAMLFEPNSVVATTGEQIRFVLTNKGALDHEFMLATRAENDRHAIAMRKNPDMEHDDPNGRRFAPGASAEILWRFSKSGEFNFACLIPGHREAGMDGVVAVK